MLRINDTWKAFRAKNRKKKTTRKPKKAAKGAKKNSQKMMIADILSALPNSATVIFTDGSSIPNSGPAGAGVYMLNLAPLPPEGGQGKTEVRMYRPNTIGKGTNNTGAVWAVAIAC